MKLFSIFVMSVSLWAADTLVVPKEVPKDKQEEVSREMIKLQGVQMATRDAKIAVQKAEEAETKAVQDYLTFIGKLKKDLGIPAECDIHIDKSIVCPPKLESAK
jgi:hypothetical protein